MDKFCVFCGQKPEGKNKEHILPHWLIAFTGDPNRTVKLGIQRRKDNSDRLFAYDSFTFPACMSCNSRFSILESSVKPVILSLLSHEAIDAHSFHILLDWFDKVRIGLWLAFYYLDQNLGNIQPNFHIASRIGMQDRMLHIIRCDGNSEELSFRCADMPSFYYTPSCFSIIINNLCFINMSSPFFISRRVGFPFPSRMYFSRDGLLSADLKTGIERCLFPVIPVSLRLNGTGIYQPMFVSQLLLNDRSPHYDSEYVMSNCADHNKGIGNVFIQSSGRVQPYPSDSSKDWLPIVSYPRSTLNADLSIVTFELQDYIDKQLPSTKLLPDSERKWFREMLLSNRRHNQIMIEALKKTRTRVIPNKSLQLSPMK